MSNQQTISQWQKAAYEQAKKSGFHEGDPPADMESYIGNHLHSFLMNIHAEVSEAWESWRDGEACKPCSKATRMIEPLTCLEEELADIVIRVLDTAETFGIDLERAIRVKHAYNGTRPLKHGGKLA